MPTSTFTPGDEKQDEKLNPGQRAADQLVGAEKRGTMNMDDFERNYQESADGSQEDANIEKARQAEENPSDGWRNNTEANPGKSKEKAKGWFRKAGPLIGLGGGLGIGGFILIALTSPSLLIVQMKETMVNKFNTQLSAMEIRSNKLLVSKVSGATSGFCTSTVSIRCKFTTMSDKQIKRMADAGIEVKGEKTLTGRTRPTSLVFQGSEISPSDFSKTASANADFRSALKQGYNVKYAGFTGKAWTAVASRFKISKQAPELDAATDKEKAKTKINDIAKEGTTDGSATTKVIEGEKKDPECQEKCETWSKEDAEDYKNKMADVDAVVEDGSAANEVRSKLSGIQSGSVTSMAKITGAIDSACQVYGAVTTLNYAAKAIRAAQLVRYAMIFFSVADAIKAGESPDPEDVALLGDTLTTTVKDSADPSKTLVGSATDSFGYKYAQYGDSSASDQSMQIANRFLAGGGLVGSLSLALDSIMQFIPGGKEAAKSTCGTLANPLVQGASIVAGIAVLLVPGANVTKTVIQGAISASVGIALAVLPGMLADIVAGTVTENIVGEESGNAITSGAGALMSDALAAQNGAAPLTKTDALAYNQLQTEVTNQYIADEVQQVSPFDVTNQYTFLGSIASKLMPVRSGSNPLLTLGSIFNSSLQGLAPTSNALTQEQYEKSLDVCQDSDAAAAGYAVDPFCNIIRGIPPQYLNKDPIQVVNDLGSEITEDGTPVGKYEEFITKCITTETPLGYEDPTTGFDTGAAADCVFNDENANYYLNYMDQRISLSMDGDDVAGAITGTVAATGKPDGAVDAKNGWTFAPGVDYSQYVCDPRTPQADLGFTITASPSNSPATGAKLRLCEVPFYGGGGGNGSNLVSSVISSNVMNMFEAARSQGVQLQLNDGMRLSFNSGYVSQHTTGLSMDIGVVGENTICRAGANSKTGWGTAENAETQCSRIGGAQYEAYKWLQANAAKYGFYNFEVEPWHWSTSGL